MTCAACGSPLSGVTPVAGLASCPACLRTVVAETGALATAAETLALTDEQIAALKAQRKAARKARAV